MNYVEAQQLIRKPASEVMQAFVDPARTRYFWFTASTGELTAGATLTWHWEMYKVSTKVVVKECIPAEKISIDWGEPATQVEFIFKALNPQETYVVIRHSGFTETGAALTAVMLDSMGGFTTVLDGLKAYLEHGINLNLIADKFPTVVKQHGNP